MPTVRDSDATFEGLVSFNSAETMNRDDDQQLWDLLGPGAKARVSPFFARNILRQIRQEPQVPGKKISWLNFRICFPLLGQRLRSSRH